MNYDKTCFVLFHAMDKNVPEYLLYIDVDGIMTMMCRQLNIYTNGNNYGITNTLSAWA